MMAAATADGALPPRLARLTGSDGDGCVAKFAGTGEKLRRGPRFEAALRRHRALADENRLLAATMLRLRGELCACEIQAATGLTHATVSHHMAILEEAGVIVAERRGKWMYYRLARDAEGLIP